MAPEATPDPPVQGSWTARATIVARYRRALHRGATIYDFRAPEPAWFPLLLDRIEWAPTWRISTPAAAWARTSRL